MSIVLLDAAGVAAKLKLKKSTPEGWAYGRKAPPAGFPSPIKVSNRLRWREDEIDAWLISQSDDSHPTRTKFLSSPSNSLVKRGHGSASPASLKRGRGRPRNAPPTLAEVQAQEDGQP